GDAGVLVSPDTAARAISGGDRDAACAGVWHLCRDWAAADLGGAGAALPARRSRRLAAQSAARAGRLVPTPPECRGLICAGGACRLGRCCTWLSPQAAR